MGRIQTKPFLTSHTLIERSHQVDPVSPTGGSELTLFKGYGRKCPKNRAQNVKSVGGPAALAKIREKIRTLRKNYAQGMGGLP